MKTEIKVIKYMLKIAVKEKPSIFIVYLLRFIDTLINRIQQIILPKFLIDELIFVYNNEAFETHLKNAAFVTLAIIGINFLSRIIEGLATRMWQVRNEFFNEYIEVQLNDRIMAIDYELTENPEALNQMNKAQEGGSWYSGNVCGILDQFFYIITNVIVLCGLVGVIAVKCPIFIPIEIVVLIIEGLLNRKNQNIEVKFWGELSKFNRIFSYLFFELSDFSYGKDIRFYSAQDLFTKKADNHLRSQEKIWRNQHRETRPNNMMISFVDIVANMFYFAFVALKAFRLTVAKFSVGDCAMCINAIQNINSTCSSIVMGVQEILKKTQYANEYIKFMEYPDAISKGTKSVLNQKEHLIEFKNVSFKYPRSENYVLKNINISIPSGQHLALVGLNGAGKTTFIKLLCRLYDVTEGEILIDGVNIKEYSDDEYRKLFAVVFQDFKLFAFSLKENILLGQKEYDKESFDKALKLVDLYDDVQNLPKKEETAIFKNFEEDGVELSGGQKQKVAICRALYKDSPVVIMDEPTAALDPLAEAEIYSSFNKLVGGKTALYISHRLSSCKFCDKIAVFGDNTIKEYGNHEELMKKTDGLYYEMFTTQAKQYVSQD